MSGRAERTFVAESGMKPEKTTRRLRKPGAGVVLVGEAAMCDPVLVAKLSTLP